MLRTQLFRVVFVTLIVSSFHAFTQVALDSSLMKLREAVNKLSADPVMKNAKWGICIITADSDKTVFAYNDTVELIPASTMKAINTAAALKILGPDFTFKTYLFYDGDIDSNGILHGNIYIRGGGDPTLGSPRLDTMNDKKYLMSRWVRQIKKQGINRIDGAVVGDASILDDTIVPPTWVEGDLGHYYGAGASGLTFHESAFRIVLKPGEKYGDSAIIKEIDPPIPYIAIKNKVSTGSLYTPDDLWVYGIPYNNERLVKGVVPRVKSEFSIRASLPDPAAFCAYSLFKSLQDGGIIVKDSAITLRELKKQGKLKSRALTFIYKQESPSLDSITYYTNIYSINTYAENILKMLAYETTGAGSTNKGTELVTQFWRSKGVNLHGFVMKDGSGLSPSDRVSPRQLAEILRTYIGDTMFPVFYHTLPIAGRSGSISSIFKGTIAENNLRAKSGYMLGLRSYTGYTYNKKKKLLTFGVIVNNHSATPAKIKDMLEKIMVLIAETEW